MPNVSIDFFKVALSMYKINIKAYLYCKYLNIDSYQSKAHLIIISPGNSLSLHFYSALPPLNHFDVKH